MDGHTGISNSEIKRGGSGGFKLVLSYLRESSGECHYIIHASSEQFYFSGIQPNKFLLDIGFNKFNGQCQFFDDMCYYLHLARAKFDEQGFEDIMQNINLTSAFEKFANEGITKLYELQRQRDQVLRELGFRAGPLKIFNEPIEIEIEPGEIPGWVNTLKFERLKELEAQRETINSEIKELEGYLPLLYADGDLLVSAVLKVLMLLGLNAEKTERGYFVDILAETKDGTKKFGFEVTGVTGPIKKDSNKLSQIANLHLKERDRKPVLVANTFKNIPIKDRQNKESFSKDAIDFLSEFKALLMTGWDLYRIAKKILEEKDSPEPYIDKLYNQSGIFCL